MTAITITKAPDGLYQKLGGAPLQPGQAVLLDEGVINLPACGPRESTYRGCLIRAWVIPALGGSIGLSEVIVPDELLAGVAP